MIKIRKKMYTKEVIKITVKDKSGL